MENDKLSFSDGSGLCCVTNKNIQMQLDKYGKYIEVFSNNQGLTEDDKKVMPLFKNKENSEDVIAHSLFGNIEGIKRDKYLGYYQDLYVGHVLEGEYRKNGSSGGVATWILCELLRTGNIDGVIHVKKAKKEDKILFKYDISKTMEEVIKGAKTRYYPVELSQVFNKLKNMSGRFAIVGIPSFIYGVRLLCSRDKDFNSKIAFTVGLICGHQKTSKFVESMAWQMGLDPHRIEDIDFRVKVPNKLASDYSISVKGYKDNELTTITKSNKELFGQNWGQGFFKVKASDFTDDVFNETADITVGDAWLEEYNKDHLGNNVIIVRNSIIKEIINNGIKESKLKLDAVNQSVIFESQSAHVRHTINELPYRTSREVKKNGWAPFYRRAVEPISRKRKKVQDIRELIYIATNENYLVAEEMNSFEYFKSSLAPLIKKSNKLTRRTLFFYLKNYPVRVLFKKAFKRILKYK